MSDCSDIDNYCFYDDDDDDYVPAFNKINKEIFIGSNVLCLESGSIVDAQYDVIMNLTNPDFNLDCGTFSKLILKAAGNSIQQQCQTLHSKGVSINQVGVTTGGEMINPVKHVFHMTANNFTDNTSCIISVERIIEASLDSLIEMKQSSIAFPCLGIDIFNYPVQIVAETMVSRCFAYLNNNKDLNWVVSIVIPDEKAYAEIMKFFESEFAKLEKYLLKEANVKDTEETIEWKYKIKPNVWINFATNICSIIQKAFGQNDNEVVFQNNEDILSIACFKSMTYTELEDDAVRSFEMKMVSNDEKLSYPENWKKMLETVNFELVDVDESSEEYSEVVNSFKSSMKDIETIYVKVQRVQCKSLYEAYLIYKKGLKRKLFNENELNLWHGTSKSVENICEYGFNRSYCGTSFGTKFGKGVYFSASAKYSHNFTKENDFSERTMFRARVLVGQSTLGNEETIVPPFKNNGERYDSTCDATKTIFVCYHDSQCYPEYLINYASCE